MKLTKEQKALAKKLTQRQLAFANLVALKEQNGLSNAQCYIKAKYKARSQAVAKAASSRLLTNVNLEAYLQTFKEEAAKKVGLTYEYIHQHVKDTLETDLSHFCETVEMDIKVAGKKKTVNRLLFRGKMEDLPKNVIRSVQSIKQTKEGITFTLPPRNETYKVALQCLAAKGERIEGKLELGDGNEIEKLGVIIEKIATGAIPLAVADRIMKALQLKADLVDQIEVQERLKRIEEKLNK